MTSNNNTLPKRLGMVHIKGVNDEAYQNFINSQPKRENNVMISVVNNRW